MRTAERSDIKNSIVRSTEIDGRVELIRSFKGAVASPTTNEA
jgi:hypothetical protein